MVNNVRGLSIRLITTVVLVGIGILVMNLPSLIRHRRLAAVSLTAVATFTDSARVPAGTPPPDSAAVMAALARVIDPEVGIDIVDLGLVHSLHVDSSGIVTAAVALTTPECPYARQLGAQAVKEVIAVPGVRRATVRLDPTLPWSPDNLSPEAKERYRRMFGSSVTPAPPSSLLTPPSSLLTPRSSLLSPPSSHDSDTGR